MPVALSPEVRAQIVELRAQGKTIDQVAALLGVSRSVAAKYGTSVYRVKKPQRPKRPRGGQVGRKFYDDPRFDHPPEDEYWDVVPIPFFPADLPRLELDHWWTPARLQFATAAAHRILFPKRTRYET